MAKLKVLKVKGPMYQEHWELFIQACSDGGLGVMGSYDTSQGQIDSAIQACSCTRDGDKDNCHPVNCDNRDKDLVCAVLRALQHHRRIKVRFAWVKA